MFYYHSMSAVKVLKHDAIATLGETDAKFNASYNMALYVSKWSSSPFCRFAIVARPATLMASSYCLFPL
jgi:hypothetical protein